MYINKNIFIVLFSILFCWNHAQKRNSIPYIIDGGGTKSPTVTLKMGPGVYREWMAYNLGANTNLVANYPVKEIHGDYYQFGTNTPMANASTPTNMTGWVANPGFANAWNSGTESAPVKTANDPCPSGFRIPTSTEWEAVGTFNIYAKTGNWTDSETNFYGAAVLTNPDDGNQYMILPSAGVRNSTDGKLLWRGENANYWSSTSNTSSGSSYSTNLTTNGTDVFKIEGSRTYGQSVRCIKQ